MAWFNDNPVWDGVTGSSHSGPVVDTVHAQYANEPVHVPNPASVVKIAGVDGHETIVPMGWKLVNGVFKVGLS